MSVDVGETIKLQLHKTPVLRWHNPIRATTHGECFVWTQKNGRPAAFASIFSYPKGEANRNVAHAMNSFETGALTLAEQGRGVLWESGSSEQVASMPVPEAPDVAPNASRRLLQMRAMAREFTATAGGATEEKRELRLLSAPVFRTPQTDESEVDAALFVFVMGTDPEIVLLIESREIDGKRKWYYQAGRHSHVSLELRHKDMKVWEHKRGMRTTNFVSQHGVDLKPRMLE